MDNIDRKCTNFERKLRKQMTKKHILPLILALFLVQAESFCQESTSIFNFLSLPSSSHMVGLGGKNISLVQDEIHTAAANPALLSNISDKSVGVNFMSYMQGCKAGGAAYAQTAGSRGTWGVYAQFVGYGSMKETNLAGEILGDMKPLDFCIGGQYSYMLTERLSGGATGKIIYSHYGEFSSCALAVDLGLNYFWEEKNFSISAVARNIGGQVKRFGNVGERLPFDMRIGFTKGLGHAPIDISVTMVDLTHCSQSDYFSSDGQVSGGRIFTNHFEIGVDAYPIPIIYICAGFNFRRAFEMQAAGSSHAAGLSFGAGVNLKKLKVGIAYAKYHIGAPTLSLNFAYSFQKSDKE